MCPGWVRTDLGGRGAPRSVEEGGRSIVACVERPGPGDGTAGFWRDGARLAW